ncbi:MAG: Xaa-Pro peptidase family protein, partial [Candidatus Acidiferrales bacterium]
QQAMGADEIDAFVITHTPNIFYLSGFSGSSAVLVVKPSGATLFTDPRYTIQAKQEAAGVKVRIVHGPLLAAAGGHLESARTHRVGFEAARITVAQKAALEKATGKRARWTAWDGRIERARAVKDSVEIETMREAAAIACAAWLEVLPLVKVGAVEADLAAEIEYNMRRKGATGPAFDTIVASGERAALPHARASRKAIKKNELVVFDLGAILRGYSSDLTRTVFVGHAPMAVRRQYKAVLEAQEAARVALRPGVHAEEVDAAARGVLQRAGLAAKFVHSTGHGLGLEVHEMPRLGRGDKSILLSGAVVTLEPGVYFEGHGGIRIEDDAVVTETGAEYLTRANRELIELG